MQCYGCNQLVEAAHFSEHLSNHHAEETCDTCGAKVQGTVGLLNHIQEVHYATIITPSPQKYNKSTATTKERQTPKKTTPSPVHPFQSTSLQHHTATPINWKGFLPEQFRKVIHEADQVWVAKCLYEATGQLRQKLHACWFYPPTDAQTISS